MGLAIWFLMIALRPDWATRRVVLAPAVSDSAPTIPETPAPTDQAPRSYHAAAVRAMPSVVNIFTTKEVKRPKSPYTNIPFLQKFFEDGSEEDETQHSLGSGVVVSLQGYILTNNHVVEAADEIEVALADGRKAVAKVVGTDPEADLAVIKVDLKDLRAIPLGHIDQTKVGDIVLAIGNPFGVGETVTKGIVSALGRNHLGISTFENFIQTDAAINPGNSGGALVDTEGNLLGINTVIYSRSGDSLGIGFAIPVSTAKTVMDSIIKTGQVVRGWIGVDAQDITPELAAAVGLKRKTGAVVAGVIHGGPADNAGMKPADVLITVEGKPVTDATEMLNLIAQLTPGSNAKMLVLRNNQELVLGVTIGKRPKMKREDD
jgi:serine protease DegQ